MPTFLQPVEVPERCFLQEVLYWVAFQRLPIASYTLDGKELRDTDEIGGYVVEFTDSTLSQDETARAGIPTDPDWIAWLQEQSTLPVAHYNHFLARNDLDDDFRRALEVEREAAIAYERDCESWSPHYQRAIEYPASRIFVALRSGSLGARGRLMPGATIDLAHSKLEAERRDIFDIALTDSRGALLSLSIPVAVLLRRDTCGHSSDLPAAFRDKEKS